MSNITYATRTPVITSSLVNKTAEKVYGPTDFPMRELLQPALDEAGFELSDSYAGKSANPFMVEAFRAAILANKTDVFERESGVTTNGSVDMILSRFGFKEPRLHSMLHPLDSLDEVSRGYYLATMALAVASVSTRTSPKTVTKFIDLAYCVKIADQRNLSPLFSFDRMQSLAFLVSCLNYSKQNIGLIMMFNTNDLKRFTEVSQMEHYVLLARAKDAFGCADLDETIAFVGKIHEGLLRTMLPELLEEYN